MKLLKFSKRIIENEPFIKKYEIGENYFINIEINIEMSFSQKLKEMLKIT